MAYFTLMLNHHLNLSQDEFSRLSASDSCDQKHFLYLLSVQSIHMGAMFIFVLITDITNPYDTNFSTTVKLCILSHYLGSFF